MTELSEGAQRAAERVSERLKSARGDYVAALLDLVSYVEGHARTDEQARRLLEEVRRTQDVLITENLSARDLLA